MPSNLKKKEEEFIIIKGKKTMKIIAMKACKVVKITIEIMKVAINKEIAIMMIVATIITKIEIAITLAEIEISLEIDKIITTEIETIIGIIIEIITTMEMIEEGKIGAEIDLIDIRIEKIAIKGLEMTMETEDGKALIILIETIKMIEVIEEALMKGEEDLEGVVGEVEEAEEEVDLIEITISEIEAKAIITDKAISMKTTMLEIITRIMGNQPPKFQMPPMNIDTLMIM
jgi:hypothetical protein